MGRRSGDPDQLDLFEPPGEWREDGRGVYLQFLIAPPTELSVSRPHRGPRSVTLARSDTKGARD